MSRVNASMWNVKRGFSAALAAALMLAAGCGEESDSPSAGAGAKPAPPAHTSTTGTGTLDIERTVGRLGDAVTAEASDPVEKLLGRGGPIPDDVAEPPSDDTGVAGAAACRDGELEPTAANVARVRASTLCFMNAERRAEGLPALKSHARLARAALRHSRDMVKRRYFAHNSPSGRSVTHRLRAARYIPKRRSWIIGENLAWGSGALSSSRPTVQAWMNSPPHRKNLLSASYASVGIGIALGNPSDGGGGATYTTNFGRIR